MSKKLPCPNCKNTIVVDPQTLAGADSITCDACGSSFKLKKKPSQPVAAAPVAPADVMDAEVVDAPIAEADPLGLGAMNFNDLGGMAQTGFDPLSVPTADPLGTATPPAGSAPPASYYAPTTVQVPAQNPAKRMSTAAKVMIAVGSVLGVLLLSCGIGVWVIARSFMNFGTDQQNLKMVSLAMLNYESTFKRFPAPAAMDVEKKPVYAWTASVTPFTDENAKFQSFDASRMLPWDAPGNEILQGKSPELFRSARGNAKANERNVFLLCMPFQNPPSPKRPMFTEGRYTSISEIVDGTSSTILAIQLTRFSKPWAQPGELTPEEAYDLLQKEPGGALVVMCDGYVKWIPTTIPREKFDAMTTLAGFETVTPD